VSSLLALSNLLQPSHIATSYRAPVSAFSYAHSDKLQLTPHFNERQILPHNPTTAELNTLLGFEELTSACAMAAYAQPSAEDIQNFKSIIADVPEWEVVQRLKVKCFAAACWTFEYLVANKCRIIIAMLSKRWANTSTISITQVAIRYGQLAGLFLFYHS
jgi:hypothetical protein